MRRARGHEMGRRRRAKKKRKRGAATEDTATATDRITALPLDLRARIASFLPYWQVIQLSELSRPWRHLCHQVPVVNLDLRGLVFPDGHHLAGVPDVDALVSLRVALVRRAREWTGSKVEMLRLTYSSRDLYMKRHADRLIALADASDIRLTIPYGGSWPPADHDCVPDGGRPWTVDLPPAARDQELRSRDFIKLTVAGPGAAVLRELYFDELTLGEWPRLPSLRSLTLVSVTATAPFAPGASCPLLEHLLIWNTTIEHADPRVDIRLPLLKTLDMDQVDINPCNDMFEPFAVVTVDTPELQELTLTWTSGRRAEYKSFALRAPRLRYLSWFGQFAERVSIDVGTPASISEGTIGFTSNEHHECYSCREVKEYRAQMMRMLEGLLPGLPPERVADVAGPYMTLKKYTVKGDSVGERIPEEELTCDLHGLMSSRDL